jgi:hypothetical protein
MAPNNFAEGQPLVFYKTKLNKNLSNNNKNYYKTTNKCVEEVAVLLLTLSVPN